MRSFRASFVCFYDFVELRLYRDCVAVLRMLQHEHHQECQHRRARVDHELPGVAVVEERSCDRPYDAGGRRQDKGQGMPGGPGAPAGKVCEELVQSPILQ